MGSCNGNCGSCGGCAKEMEITEKELNFLQEMSQIPFLPVARTMGDLTAVYLEAGVEKQEEYAAVLACLEKKGLISLDFDKPLKTFDYSAYQAYPIRGSIALTQRGCTVVDLLERQGIREA